jgi:hypothetical protein
VDVSNIFIGVPRLLCPAAVVKSQSQKAYAKAISGREVHKIISKR